MAFKFICFTAFLAAASAIEQTAEYHQGAYGHVPTVYKAHHVEHEEPAQYNFEYSVNDQHTGDVKEHKESRQGDATHGYYSLIDADGYKRTVEYTVDAHSGFVAKVHREPVHGYAPVAKVAAPAYHHVAKVAAPAYHHVAKVAAPAYQTYEAAPAHVYQQAYAAPVAKVAYSAPVAKVVAHQAPVYQQHYTAPAKVVAHQAPVYQHYAAPVAKVVAAPAYHQVTKVAAAPAYHAHGQGHSYVTYTGPNSSYHY